MSKDYNVTLNLPKTDFPMRAGLPAREPGMLRQWQELDVYAEHLKKSEGPRSTSPSRTSSTAAT